MLTMASTTPGMTADRDEAAGCLESTRLADDLSRNSLKAG